MLKVRLQRVGRKNVPAFRVVLTDSHNGPKSGKVLEVLGFYHAQTGVSEINGERIKHHISLGAQVSDTIHNMLVEQKIITGKKINVLPRKSPLKKDVDESATEQSAPATEEATKPAEAEVVA